MLSGFRLDDPDTIASDDDMCHPAERSIDKHQVRMIGRDSATQQTPMHAYADIGTVRRSVERMEQAAQEQMTSLASARALLPDGDAAARLSSLNRATTRFGGYDAKQTQ